MVIFFGFGRIVMLACCNALVLSMIEHKILDSELFREFACFLNGRMILFIRLKLVAVAVFAEGFG